MQKGGVGMGDSLDEIMNLVDIPPEPTALLERMESRTADPDIALLVAAVRHQARALKAADAVIEQLYLHVAASAMAAYLRGEKHIEDYDADDLLQEMLSGF
jgi:hypothetical protein